ncbi:MAG: hypothetical protein QW756_04650 [Nitrososphaerota archaeon]
MSEIELMEKLEYLYSIVNRARFYESLGDMDGAEKLRHEYKTLAKELRLSEEEVEAMADELDDYYVAGKSSYESDTPLDHWLSVVVKRFSP